MRPQEYEHHNVNGPIPTVAKLAKLAFKHNRKPRMMSAEPMPNAVLFLFETANRKVERRLLTALKETGWGFTHAAIGSQYHGHYGQTTRGTAAFHVLATLS